MPTATSATSLTMDSIATAMTMPSCRSVGSNRRTPNMMVKMIMRLTTIIPTCDSIQTDDCLSLPVITENVERMDLNWRAT